MLRASFSSTAIPFPALALLAAITAFLVLVLPILWFAGALTGLARFLSPGAMAALWAGWAVLAAIFVWMLIGMWRRAA